MRVHVHVWAGRRWLNGSGGWRGVGGVWWVVGGLVVGWWGGWVVGWLGSWVVECG